MADEDRLQAFLLRAGTTEHYEDAALYDHEYRRRRRDVNWYRALAREVAGGAPLRILELGCGTGRLLVPLLRDGHEVVGIDRSQPMLRRCAARIARLPPARRACGHLVRADFRELPLREGGAGQFPLVLCPFNAMMHLYERADVERFLAQVKAHLAPGGLLAFDVLHPDVHWLGRDPERRWSRTRFRHPETGEPLIYTTSHTYDPARQLAMVRIFYDPDDRQPAAPGPPAAPRVIHLAHRQFFPAELEALLHYNGFFIERREGGFDGEPLTHTSTEQVIRARVR